LTSRGAAAPLAAWRSARRASHDFQALLDTTRAELAALYASDDTQDLLRAEKHAAFDRLRERYQALVDGRWHGKDHFAGWFRNGLNNAGLALTRTYAGGQCAFAELFTEAGADFGRFYHLAEARAALSADARRVWLEHRCTAIASTGNL
jgi:predicted aminopeptidase